MRRSMGASIWPLSGKVSVLVLLYRWGFRALSEEVSLHGPGRMLSPPHRWLPIVVRDERGGLEC